ncbi:DUF4433 domain-containing protein [Paludibacterium yongneupense]|uniref:DUF4433 domain-containing protein n=1 Tax=Paludibacterium yongneupense TaxID=400061 RepID=UPI0009FFBBAF
MSHPGPSSRSPASPTAHRQASRGSGCQSCDLGLPLLFTDSHAYYRWANFYDAPADLDKIDWDLLQRKDFKRDPDDPAKFERYQAEALIHQYVPVDGLLGVVCHTDTIRQHIERKVQTRGLSLSVVARQEWYFS